MKIGIIGTGYVGLPTGVGLADLIGWTGNQAHGAGQNLLGSQRPFRAVAGEGDPFCINKTFEVFIVSW